MRTTCCELTVIKQSRMHDHIVERWLMQCITNSRLVRNQRLCTRMRGGLFNGMATGTVIERFGPQLQPL
jgi:hypothetical protein